MRLQLQFRSGHHAGHVLEFTAPRVVTLGRSSQSDVQIYDERISRRHCAITAVRGGYLLRDESANGTLVNGARMSGTYLLGHGDVVRVGDEELRFEVDGAAASAPTATAPSTEILDVSRLRAEYAAAGPTERPATPIVANLEIVRGPFSGASFSIDRPRPNRSQSSFRSSQRAMSR